MEDFFSLIDTVLIAPFRLLDAATGGFWLGTTLLALWCLILGELTHALVFRAQRKRLFSTQDKARHFHNLSVDAIHAGDKKAYLATNSLAQEQFGQGFFVQAVLGLSSIWPLPFALAWLGLRFEGIILHKLPFFDVPINYVCVFITLYVLLRVFLGPVLKRMPLIRQVEKLKRQAAEQRPEAKHF